MTRLNFPTNPADGQTVTINSITYTWVANGSEEGYWSANGEAINLQSVTDNGNTTTQSIIINDNITLNNTGTGVFDAAVRVGGNSTDGTANGVILDASGAVTLSRAADNVAFELHTTGTADPTIEFNSNGGAQFLGRVTCRRDVDTNAGLVIQNSASENQHIFFGNGQAQFHGGDTSIDLNGSLSTRQNVVMEVGGIGVRFPADNTGNVDPNTLDDYEEGTWTPAITSGGATFTNSSQSGQYTKVGNLVTLSARVVCQMSAITGANAAVTMNVPFTILNDSNGAPILRVTGGGSFFGATRGISNDLQVYPTQKGASSFLEMGNVNVNFYPASTNVTIMMSWSYVTDQ